MDVTREKRSRKKVILKLRSFSIYLVDVLAFVIIDISNKYDIDVFGFSKMYRMFIFIVRYLINGEERTSNIKHQKL